MNRFLRVLFFLSLFFLNLALWTYHRGAFPPPSIDNRQELPAGSSQWIPKEKWGINQLILHGNPWQRGLQAGRLTAHLLELQENDLVKQLRVWIPNESVLQGLILAAILWYQGVDHYFPDEVLQEMYGVSQSAPHQFDYLADGLTRQVAYHGLHEVGQMVVDQGFEAMGCTVVALPWQGSWILGRNFDFEGGRIFDSEKIMKWVFPDQGYAFVSIIWAGMVGAVTGVNEKGVYISLNAAGSSDFKRLGKPSTLVLVKALQAAATAEEAVEIIRREQMFITDIFVVMDSRSGNLYRVEKSPERVEVLALKEASIVTNHLIGEPWKNDSTNNYRREYLTSQHRANRGQVLTAELQQKNIKTDGEMESGVLSILRDKAGEHIGNRRAIDALIATHAVVLNGKKSTLYVSQGPGLSGGFTGFDLKESFRQQRPVVLGQWPGDPEVSAELFQHVRASSRELTLAQILARRGKCQEAQAPLERAAELFQEQNFYYEVLGDWYECQGDMENAQQAWKKSLDLHPPYLATEQRLRKKVGL